ncbi:MAG TPA: hypothetical protein VGS59_11265 [Candidatus Acidoferrales bacterium]|nr:hypothetical protein [Candidatus Acidoferrales bacterium]
MTKKRATKKTKIVWVGSTAVARITPKERKKLHKLMKKRLAIRRKQYPEVHGKMVDYITHFVDGGTVFFSVWFKDKTAFSLRYGCDLFIVGADFSDWKTGDDHIIREYMKPIPR